MDQKAQGDGEFPRGREGRPSSPSPKASTLRVHVAEPTDMCKPGGSPRSDETIVPVRVPVEPTMSSRIGVPGPNSFRIRREALAREGRDALSLSVILPPATVQTRKTSTVRSLSAHPSPPRMENRIKSSASSKPIRGSNKPLPMSPTSECDPLNSAGLKNGAMHHYPPSPREPPPGVSPSTSHASEHEAIRTLQQKYEAHSKLLKKHGHDMVRLEKKIDDLSIWTQEQFRDLIERFGNMSQANSDMFAKQTQLSYDIAKSRLELKNELKSEIYEMRTEINGLTASFSDLNAKVDICLQRLWDNSDETFTEHQCRKNERMEEDLENVKDQLDYLKQLVIRVRVGLTLAQPNHALSYTPVASQPPIAPGQAPALTASPSMGNETLHPAKRTLTKQISTPQFSTKRSPSKLTSGLLRSASGTASAFKAAKEAIDRQDASADNNRRWGLFKGRRRNASDTSSGTGKFPWSGRRQKEDDISNIPPVPSIPKGIARIHSDTKPDSSNPRFGYPMDNVHPALRPQGDESYGVYSPTTGPSEKTSPVEVATEEVVSLPSTYVSSPAETRRPDSPVEARASRLPTKEDVSK